MSKYEPIITIVFTLTKNKSLIKYIMLYIIGEEPCKYLKDIVHYHIFMNYNYFNYLDFVHIIDIILWI